MRTKITLMLLTFSVFAFGQKIELKLKNPEAIILKNPRELKPRKDVNVDITLTNNTKMPLTYFDSQYESWDSFKEEFSISINGKPVKLNNFKDAPESKFKAKTIITLQPGESHALRGKLIWLDTIGHYKVTYTQKQAPEYVQLQYADNDEVREIAKKINKFVVTGTLEFDVKVAEKKAVTQINKMTWEQWRAYRVKDANDYNNIFTSYDDAMENPNKVYSLDLKYNELIEEMIKDLPRFKNLKKITIRNFDKGAFPAEFLNFSNLFELEVIPIRGKNVTFPPELKNLKSLRVLSFQGEGGLQKEIFELDSLETLINKYNSFTSIPDLSKFKFLQVLMLPRCGLTSIDGLGLEKLTALTSLDLSSNNTIVSFAPAYKCTNLTYLNLDRCKITSFPDELRNMKKLKILIFGDNLITSVPESIGELTDLTDLDLSGDKSLTELPTSILKLKNLRKLYIGDTGIKELPEGLSDLPLTRIVLLGLQVKKTKDYTALKERLKSNFVEDMVIKKK